MKYPTLKRFIGILVYTILISYMLMQYILYQEHLGVVASLSNEKQLLYYIVKVFLPIAAGVSISLPRFVVMLKEEGRWRIDWIKLIAAGLPTLYMAILPLLALHFGLNNLPFVIYLLYRHAIMPIISGVVFGYLLLAVFNKNKTLYQ